VKVPLSWLVELLPAAADVAVERLAVLLTDAGLAVEGVEHVGRDLDGVVVARVLDVEELTGFKKAISYVHADTGEADPRGIVCGARNFRAGDTVLAALPGAVLPGGFAIAARETYGRTSDGMLCSARELGLGDDAEGILVLPGGLVVGTPAAALVADTVLDVAVGADRGYALSLRGLARELATALGVGYDDPGAGATPALTGGLRVRIDDTAGCTRYVARTAAGIDPVAETPLALRRRLALAGMRSISPAVDVTNLVLLGLGQPLHAFDLGRLSGGLVVRRAAAGERLVTLDGVDRALHPADLVVADDSGPVALAGVMGGRSTEVTRQTSAVLLEAACFDPVSVTRTVARHGLGSEAARRFERGVDPGLAPAAAAVALALLHDLTGATADPAGTDVDRRPAPLVLRLPVEAATRKAGRPYDAETVRRRLRDVGCTVAGSAPTLAVTPPSWRPDLTGEVELVEEVVRLEGYASIPSELPRARPGRGLTREQQARRAVGRALAAFGLVEAVVPPFLGAAALAALGLDADDDRRNAAAVANPLSTDAALLRTTLLPGLLATLARNDGRGQRDIGLYEVGAVVRPGRGTRPAAPRLPGGRRPSDAELAALDAALPAQPVRVAVVLAGARQAAAWEAQGRAAGWTDAVQAAQTVARAVGVGLSASPEVHAPWHPGRCAALSVLGPADDGGGAPVTGALVGHAGELHPRVCAAFGVPPRTCAVELDLATLLVAAGPAPPRAPTLSPFPAVGRDVALTVDAVVPAASVEAALRSGAGPLLASLRLFDRYEGAQAGTGRVSLAYRLSFRAADRTLTDEEANAARDAASAAAEAATGAAVRA